MVSPSRYDAHEAKARMLTDINRIFMPTSLAEIFHLNYDTWLEAQVSLPNAVVV